MSDAAVRFTLPSAGLCRSFALCGGTNNCNFSSWTGGPSAIVRAEWAVANGEAELGLFILNVLKAPGVELVGPFPAELQQNVVYTTAVGVNAADADAARQFIDFLRAPAAVAVIRSQGMTPV